MRGGGGGGGARRPPFGPFPPPPPMAAAAARRETMLVLLLFEERLHDEVCENDAPFEYMDPVEREREAATYRGLDSGRRGPG